MRKKILILTAPVGGGHVATAKAIAQALTTVYGDAYDIEVCDVFTDPGLKLLLPLDKIAVPAYSNSVKILNSYPYKLFFDFANVNPKFVSQFFTTIFREKGMAYFKLKNPDIIVSTFPIISYAAARILNEVGEHRVPVVSIVTDAGAVHKLWLMSPTDDILVSTPETIDYAVKHGVPRDRLHYLGFPVRREFSELPDRQTARRQLGLQDLPTTYLTGGGLGLSTKLVTIAKRLAKQETGGQYIFQVGRNERQVEELKSLDFKDPVQVYGWVDNVPQLLAASDLVVGKAGWLTLNEAMIAKRPTIIINVVPGQEEPNAVFVESNGVGRVLKEPSEAADAIADYMSHPNKLAAFAPHFERLGLDPHAGDKVAKFIIERMEVGAK
ncbi:MAG TPA: glycosyltransferase [Patescibacteria group bacterium]|nr:glycosyltransferase [Patescibacteria group bacterium]HSX48094.1 glycosyltransferase [Candidatus Nanoarchaeia archaeon]